MALGRRFRIAWNSLNPYDKTIWFDNPGPSSPSFQIVHNDVIIGEYTAGQYVLMSFAGGSNVLQVVVQDGGVVVGGLFISPEATDTNKWISLFPQGADPILNVPGSGGGLSSTDDIGLGGGGPAIP